MSTQSAHHISNFIPVPLIIPGVVDYKESEGQKYRVRWLDGTVSTQSAHHISNFIPVPPIIPGVIDYKESEGQKYRVRWLDGTVSTQSAHHISNFIPVPPIIPGVIDYKESEGQKYRVRWLDGTVSTQSAHHIFLVQQHRAHDQWNYILAPTEQPGGNILYKPAKVVLIKPLQVLFCDGTR